MHAYVCSVPRTHYIKSFKGIHTMDMKDLRNTNVMHHCLQNQMIINYYTNIKYQMNINYQVNVSHTTI